MDPHHFGLPLPGLPGAFATAAFHPPLPVDQRTHDGRYVWDTTAARMHAAYHHPAHGISGGTTASPTLTDFQFSAQRRQSAATAAMMNGQAADIHGAYRLNPYVEHLYGYPNPSFRGLSPVDTRGLPMHPDYIHQMSTLGHRSVMSDFHGSVAPSTIASTDLPFSLESSRLTTPRPSIRQSRKRALSSSPYSDSFDINSMIRFSPNSLVSIMNGSRSGSSTSGSYGHLSAGTISPALGMHPSSVPSQLQQLQHLMRQGTIPSSPFLPHHSSLIHHQSAGLTASQQSLLMAQQQSQVDHMLAKEHPPHPLLLHPNLDQRKERVKKEPLGAVNADEKNGDGHHQSGDPMKDEPGDFIETNCHWKECEKEFNTQEELVKHINNDHIHANKKSFVCRWKDCSREEKPFKAQYMLVVHMRRHTGEKPHRCTFEGCSKAYSRLENLKTHLRSHTGEKPYMCEFPGCTKAFSNASDRAKHQNRTHSNEKPYVCKAPGCTKRYTDPSSLRKHVKTVHGAEFYANKKHKGVDHCNQSGNDNNGKDGDNCAADSSPRSDDGSAVKLSGSLSSPSIKSEDTSSPPQQQHSPLAVESNVLNGFDTGERCDFITNPVNDNNISTSNNVGIIEDSQWELVEADELDIPEAAMAAAVIGGSLSSNGNFVQDRNARNNRIKNNLQSKSRLAAILPPLPAHSGGPRRGGNVQETDIKPLSSGQRKNIDLSFNTSVPRPNQNYVGNRKDSSTSTVSSFYSSMRSENSPHPFGSQMSSRRGSEFSQVSGTHVGTLSSAYDPISPGSSRKSSNISNYQGITATMTAHLQRLHRKAIENQRQEMGSTANLVVQTQNMSINNSQSTTLPKISSAQGRQTSMSLKSPLPQESQTNEARRSSDPVRPLDRNFGVNQRLSRHRSQGNFSKMAPLPPINKQNTRKQESKNNAHPNGDILLEELDENAPIETNQNLIIPDEMVRYLNQVAEKTDGEKEDYFDDKAESEISLPFSSVSQYAEHSPRYNDSAYNVNNGNNLYNNNNGNVISPTYATLQPVKISKQNIAKTNETNNAHFCGQSNAFGANSSNGMLSGNRQRNQCNMLQNQMQPVQQIMPNIPQQQNVHCMSPQQQNTPYQMNYGQQMNNFTQMNSGCYGHQQQNNHVMCQNNQMQSWSQSQCSGQNSGNYQQHGMMNTNTNGCNYQQMQQHDCSNQMMNAPAMNNNHMYSNNTVNYVPNHMCNNCGTSAMMACNNHEAQVQLDQVNIVTNKPQQFLKQNHLKPSEQYIPQGQFHQNLTANYCMVQQQTQEPSNFAIQCSPMAGMTSTDYVFSPQSQNSIVSPASGTVHNCTQQNRCNQGEIQCNDISQSCHKDHNKEQRSTSSSIRSEAYQRTLQYVKQCQQVFNKDDSSGNFTSDSKMNKKTSRSMLGSTEMSPGCKEVTSTTDSQDKFCGAISHNVIDNIANNNIVNPPLSLSPTTLLNLPNSSVDQRANDQESRLNTPCMESLKSASHTPVLPSNNNMVINDMNSSLATFAEETKYLQLIQ